MTNKIDTPLVRLEWETASELLDNADNIVVVTHLSPDGDAIGSMLGLTIALRETGKTVTPVVDGGCPGFLKFIPHSEDIRDNVDGLAPDLVISTDSSDKSRIGATGNTLLARNNVPFIQLDHHQTNLIFGDANLVDARTVAAAEGVLDWIIYMGWDLTQDVAQALLTGLVTDTLCFRTSNVTANTFGKAQILMEAGADLTLIVQNTMARKPTSRHRLYGEVLSRMKVEDGVIWLNLTVEDFEAAGMPLGEYTGLSGYLIEADEAYISATFKEIEPTVIDCSFRAVPGFDVSQVALRLGGGGHVLASGCTIEGKFLEEVEDMVVPMLKEQVRLGKPLYR
jgi:phosphoesterase RecJ-like protein